MKTIRKILNRLREDKGYVTQYVVIIAVGFLAIIGLVVDGSGKVQANQQAYSTAAGAARAAANAVSGQAIINGATVIDGARAAAAANGYLSAAGSTGTVAIAGNRITVTINDEYSAVFLPMAFPVEATATAELITQ